MATGGGPMSRPGLRLEALVLAAGAGARFGGGKLTAPWRGRPLIEAALAAAFASPSRSVILVTGSDEAVARVASDFAQAHGAAGRLVLVHAADHAEGMAASLRAGLAALPADTDAALLFLGDMPRIPLETPPRLAAALTNKVLAAAPTYEGARGHPVLFRRNLFAALAGLSGDQGGRRILDGLGARLALVADEDPGVLFDVDLPQDLD